MDVEEKKSLDRSIIETALRKMVKGGHFDICAMDSMLKITKAQPNAELRARLHLLHCVNFGDMPADVIDALPGMIREYLGGPVIDIDDWLRPRPRPEAQARPMTNVIDITPERPKKRGLLGLF